MRRAVLALVAVMLCLPGVAFGVPGDPPIAPIAPAEGSSVAANEAGITVSFTCPAYTKRLGDGLFPPETGTADDYGAAFSTSSTVGSDGRLAATSAIGNVIERGNERGICDALLGQRSYPSPQSTPGTYFWQAWRDCPSCSGGFEVGPVVRFVIRAAGKATLKAPERAFAGYPFVVEAAYDASSRRTRVQRRSGGGWKTIASLTGNGAPIVKLKRGKQRLRAVFEVGADVVTSAEKTVNVVRARKWSTKKRDDGAYRDPERESVRFKVTGGGKRITGFRADVPTLCADPNSSTGLSPSISRVELPPVRIAPDGRFALAGTYKGSDVRFTGRLRNRKLVGARAAIAAGACTGSIAVEARRR